MSRRRALLVSRDCATGAHVTLAIGYGGRQEVIDAMRELMNERAEAGQSPADLAASLTVEDVTRHLYTAGRPDPDLVIRTSGEQRLSLPGKRDLTFTLVPAGGASALSTQHAAHVSDVTIYGPK